MPVARTSGGARTGALAVALLCLLALRLALGTSPAGLVLDAATALVAAAGTVRAARQARAGRSRCGWRLETASVALWLLAPLAWLTGVPEAVATVGRVGFVVACGAAWWLTSLGRQTWSRLRLVVDGALTGASAFVVTWSLTLEEVWAAEGGGLPGTLAVALPLGATAVAALATGVALTEIPRARRGMPRMYVLGLLVVAGSDVVSGLGGTPVWAVGFGCIAVATTLYRGTSQRREVVSTDRRLSYAPYALLLPAVVTVTVQYLGPGVPPPEAMTAAVMGALLVVRQQATLTENRLLVERLEATEQRLRHQAMHDSLTGLGGRALLHERLGAAVARHRRDGTPLAVVFVDLDDFKLVNDTFGHAAGDDVLVEIAGRLRRALQPLADGAAAFRMSGDEFAVLLQGPAARSAHKTAEVVLDAICAPVRTTGEDVVVGGSVGVARANGPATEASALLRAADVAMYGVKHGGKGGIAEAPALV